MDLTSEVLTKVEKNRYFAKGLVHGFCQKIDLFSYVFFRAKKARKKHSLIFWIENNAFWTSKVKFSHCQKKSTFSKAISPWFLWNSRRCFHMFFFLSQKSQKERFFDILDRKEYFLDLKGELLKKSKKSTFCKGVSPWYFIKNRPFPYLFFWAKKVRKKHFLIFWIEKNAF